MPVRLQTNDGSALILAIMVMLMLTVLYMASVKTSVTDMSIAENHTDRCTAFYIADGALELAVSTMNQYPYLLDDDSLQTLINRFSSLGGCSFQVEMNRSGPDVTLTSHGASEDANAIVRVMVNRVRNHHCIWNNILCGGTGKNKQLINGNVSLHGSVHICGDSLQATDPAFVISGDGGIYNNYEGMNATLSSRLPPLDTVTFNGEVVYTLNAEVRAERGRIDLDGTGQVGDPDQSGGAPPVKETVDGCYIADGFGGNSGEGNVFSDNGTSEGYDVEGGIEFPDLYEPYTDRTTNITYTTYMDYLKSQALVINGNLLLKPDQGLSSMSNGFGSISMDANGNLQINGIVYVTGDIYVADGISEKEAKQAKIPLVYDGQGTLVSEGSIHLSGSILSEGAFPSDDVLGFIAAHDLYLGSDKASQLDLMGAFFAQGQITNYKQNQVAGAMVANYCEFYNVPDLFQVPSIVEHLPPGMPGHKESSYIYQVVDNSWCEL
jgi:hypothetical protein